MRPTCETSYLGSEFLFDDLPNAFSGPNLSPKPEVLGPFLQKRGELLGPLLFGKFWRAARPRFGLERLLSPFAGLFHPLTDGAFAHAEGLGNERSVSSRLASAQRLESGGLHANRKESDP
jgi:hypothetical protein